MRQACPSCPDGNEWSSTGPTGRACTTCKGKAYIGADEPTNTEGPAGTCGCACVASDAVLCFEMRYGGFARGDERCECLCHQWDEEDDDG